MKSCPKCLGPVENYRYACHSPGCVKAGIPVDPAQPEQGEQEEKISTGQPVCGQ